MKSAIQENKSVASSSNYFLKVSLHSYDEGPPLRIWCGLTCSFSKELHAHLTALPASLCRYHPTLKIWLIDCLEIDKVLQYVGSHLPYYCVEDLPPFLSKGLKVFLLRLRTLDLPADPPLNIEPQLLRVRKYSLSSMQPVLCLILFRTLCSDTYALPARSHSLRGTAWGTSAVG
eukprot:scaffold10764_cov159-Ochromonas_danica.AAC.28